MSQSPCGARCPNPRAVHGVPIPVPLLTLPLEVCVLAVEGQTETGSKRAMECRKEGLGEDIRHLRGGGDVSKPNNTVLNEFSNEVPPDSDVLGASVRTWVPCKSYRTLVVAPQGSGFLGGGQMFVWAHAKAAFTFNERIPLAGQGPAPASVRLLRLRLAQTSGAPERISARHTASPTGAAGRCALVI